MLKILVNSNIIDFYKEKWRIRKAAFFLFKNFYEKYLTI